MTPLRSTGEVIVRIAHNLSALLLAVATALVFFQVVTRFVLGDAVGWSEVLARGLIVWSTLLAAAAGFRLGAMIPIDFLRSLLPANLQIWVIRLVTVLTLTLLVILVWQGWAMTMRVQAQRVAMLGTSMSWFYAAIPMGALAAIAGVILHHLDQERQQP